MYVIQITGGRSFRDYKAIYDALKLQTDIYGADNIIVRHGNAIGADQIAGFQAKRLGIKNIQARKPEYYGYSWDLDKDGFAAGNLRNQAMLDEMPTPDIVLAFPDRNSKGTWNMIDFATRAGILTHVYQGALGLLPLWYIVEQAEEYTISVGNRHHGDKGIYVGRPTILGNPFILERESDRNAILQQYDTYLMKELENKEGAIYTEIHRIADMLYEQNIKLICSCSPKACHADIIAREVVNIHNKDKRMTEIWNI